jgi:hypothetical protein
MEHSGPKWKEQTMTPSKSYYGGKSDVLFLQETKCAGTEVDSILARCWRQCQYVNIDSRGSMGGLAILWNLTTVILEIFSQPNGPFQLNIEPLAQTRRGSSLMFMGHILLLKKPSF